ncbi:(2Fe-2S)-binding protein [Fodinicurvata sp. EGI_FJ10296]|uniref:(2Fe-2S)-binding protein n=1 Tax=Fodinicurvata sp. EGI_FJ10296 TaxID=3231908 RepID=UPI003452FEC8
MSDRSYSVSMTVNGEVVNANVSARTNLVDFLRQDLELTGSHVGCEHGVCGACTVRVDGRIMRGCLLLAVQADGQSVETIEGMAGDPLMTSLQDVFVEENALQCGFCTPAMLLTAHEFISRVVETGAYRPDRDAIRDTISGNYCRCTGYQSIVQAVERVLIQYETAPTKAPNGAPNPGSDR